ncbi:MAG: ABC transporter substrate-binding protein, partial [Rhodocyclaceae bacterium]|nr:ABC transporter substrate-binding protein [Rhodocyclaceae bacterium]
MNVLLRAVLFVAVVAIFAVFSLGADAQPKKVRLGVEGAYPPFSEIDTSGKLKGFDIDIANALCAQMKVECVFVQLAFDGMIPALNSRKIDAVIASMSITDERKKAVDFTDRYYKTPAQFVVKKGSTLEVTPAGLKGKRVGVQRSTIHDRFVGENFKSADIVRYTKQDEVFLDLASGRVDAAVLDMIAAQVGFLKTPQGKNFHFVGPVYDDPKYFGVGAGIALRKGDNSLREDFNKAIAAIRANGIYKKIQDV